MQTKTLTRAEAVEKLRTTGTLSTDMLKPLGIPFEGFLRFAQMTPEQASAGVARVLAAYDAGVLS